MEERPHSSSHRSGSEFFICFTARPSSSSSSAAAASAAVMRVPSSKSLMSPARGRDPAAAPSLSSSLSRRLRSSGSVKGAQSPMFPAGGRRKGCGFEAAEPSSPKVTCIGQVRVKSKKKHHRAKTGPSTARSRSQRGGGSGGEASFRRATDLERRAEECLPAHKHQGWVQQLPLAICEALRSLGSEFNCFLPCGGRLCSSSSTRDEEGEKPVGGAPGEKRTAGSGSCGAVFARWLMAIQESEEGKQREVVGLVVEERETADVGLLSASGQSRGAVEIVQKPPLPPAPPQPTAAAGEEEEEGPRVSVCIPPKNALLLMRCRSDPVRMAALASRFWDSPAVRTQVVEEHDANELELVEDLAVEKKEDDEDLRRNSTQDAQDAILEPGEAETKEEVVQAVVLGAKEAEEEVSDREEESAPIEESAAGEQAQLEANPTEEVEETREEAEPKERAAAEEIKGRLLVPTGCSPAGQKPCLSRAKDVTMRRSRSSKDKERQRHSFSSEKEARRHSFSTEREVRRASFSVDSEGRRRWSFSLNKENVEPAAVLLGETEVDKKEERNPLEEEVGASESVEAAEKPSDREEGIIAAVPAAKKGSTEEESGGGGGGGGGAEKRELPDCLLLMMYEPKLSMEVSKETWVCSTDFLRWRPNHGVAAAAAAAAGPKDDPGESQCSERNAAQRTNPALPPPPQQQQPAVAPAPPSATAVKMKLLSPAAAAAPVVLTRCKSEPMRSAARLAPDACLWKSRHQPIGAIGF